MASSGVVTGASGVDVVVVFDAVTQARTVGGDVVCVTGSWVPVSVWTEGGGDTVVVGDDLSAGSRVDLGHGGGPPC